MFTVKDGKIVITSVAAQHLSQVFTPNEWNAEMLRLLDERRIALINKAFAKAAAELVAFPVRPDLPTIWGYMTWKAETDKATAVADVSAKKLTKYDTEIATLDAQIVHLMPENMKLHIVDSETPCAFSVWWSRRYSSEGAQQNDLRIETCVVPLSQQFPDDGVGEIPFGSDGDIEGDLEESLWDDEPDKDDSEVGADGVPAPDTVDDIPF